MKEAMTELTMAQKIVMVFPPQSGNPSGISVCPEATTSCLMGYHSPIVQMALPDVNINVYSA
jgi:hypothetical protein